MYVGVEYEVKFLNKLHKDEKHQTRVSLSLELISDAYLMRAKLESGVSHLYAACLKINSKSS